MAIKSGQIIHTADTTLLQRLQQGGPGGLNIPTQKVDELGNYASVAVTRDIPDLTFSMQSYDVTCALEKMLTKGGGSGPYDLLGCKPIDVASQWLPGADQPSAFDVVSSVSIPQLTPETIAYRFGVTDFAGQTVTLRGDSVFYNPGAAVVEQFVGTNAAGQILALGHPAGVYNGDLIAGPRYAQNVSVAGRRLTFGVDYTEQVTGAGAFKTVTVTLTAAAGTGAVVQVVYFTSDTVTYLQSVHANTTVKPAAIRGRDIAVYVDGVDLVNRWTGIQSVDLQLRWTIDRDLELGSSQATSSDYTGTPDLTGTIRLRALRPDDFMAKLAQVSGVASATEAIGPLTSDPVRLDVVLHHPDTGAVLKTLEVADARLVLPGYNAQVRQKLDVDIPLQSDSGQLTALDTAPS